MSKSLIVSTNFKAIDGLTSPIKKMTNSMMSFSEKATAGVHRIDRSLRKIQTTVSSSIGILGKLGLAYSGIEIGRTILNANMDLESSLASLSAITGITGDAFDGYRVKIDEVSKRQKKFTGDVAKAFEVVGSAQPELLKSADALGAVTEAAIILSKASKSTVEQSAINLTGAMNQFNLSASESNRVINALAAGSVVGASNIDMITESMKNVGAVASGANMSVEDTVAAIEVLGKFQLKGAEAGTKLRGVIIKLQKAGLGYASGQFNINDALVEASKKMNKLTTAKKKDAFASNLFGTENITAGNIMIKNISLLEQYQKGVTGTNIAFTQAAINTDTLSTRITELVDSFKNQMSSTDKNNKAINILKNSVVFLTKNMGKIILVIGGLIGMFLLLKTVVIVSKIALIAYNIILGITTALQGKSAFYVSANRIAYIAYRATVISVTAIQWLFALAVNATVWPILLVIAAITAIILVVKNWGAITKWFGKIWGNIVNFFKEFDFINFFKEIGNSIIEFLLFPLKGILLLLSKLPGKVGKMAGEALDVVNKIKFDVDVNKNIDNNKVANPDATNTDILTRNIIQTQNQKIEMEVLSRDNSVQVIKDGGINIKLSDSLVWQ